MQAVARTVPELVGGSGDLDPSTYTWLKEDGDFESPRAIPALACRGSSAAAGATEGATSTSACASTRWPRRSTGSSTTAASSRSRRRFSSSRTTCARRSGWRRWPSCTRSSCSRTTASALGEDGPSHEPIEQLASLRAIPNLLVIRPCDANETRWAWQIALEQRGRPTALVLTRQHVPTLDRAVYAPAELLRRGAYVLNPSIRRPESSRGHPDRERLRGRAHRRRRAHPAKGRACARAWSRCRRGGCSRSSRQSIARACCRRR